LAKIVGKTWSPGMNAPFDPIASQLAQTNGVKVIVCNGYKLENLDNILEGREFFGTRIG
jgi:uridylate kinase